MGLNPEHATFNDFVYWYLTVTSEALDPHVISQYRHLLPIHYTDALPIDELCRSMTGIIGDNLASRYFGAKRNMTANYSISSKPGTPGSSADVPASALHLEFLQDKTMPAAKCFLDEDNTRQITSIYAEDVSMIRRLSER